MDPKLCSSADPPQACENLLKVYKVVQGEEKVTLQVQPPHVWKHLLIQIRDGIYIEVDEPVVEVERITECCIFALKLSPSRVVS